MVTIEDRRSGQIEICECTQRSGDSLTVLRGQEGTTAQAFEAGATVSNRLTAQTLTILMSSTGVEEAPADSKAYARRNEDWIETTTKAQSDVVTNRVAVLEAEMNAVESVNVSQATELLRLDDVKVDEAPTDGLIYGRQGEAWVETVSKSTFDAEATAGDARDDAQDADTAALQSADVLLQANIDAEIGQRQDADTAIQSTFNSYVTTQDSRDDAQDVVIATKVGPDAPSNGQQYVRQNGAWSQVAVPPGTTMSDTPPASPDPGQMWWESDTGNLYLWYNDGNSSQWVPAVSAVGPAGPAGGGGGGSYLPLDGSAPMTGPLLVDDGYVQIKNPGDYPGLFLDYDAGFGGYVGVTKASPIAGSTTSTTLATTSSATTTAAPPSTHSASTERQA